MKPELTMPADGRPAILAGVLLKNAVVGAILMLVLVELVFQPRFATYQNLVNVSRMTALLALVSVGQMFVLLVRGFDLSIGSTMAFASIAVAWVLAQVGQEDSLMVTGLYALLVALVVGLVIGAANGIVVAYLKVHSFIVTLGMASIVSGAALMLTDGVPVYGIPKSFIAAVGRSTWAGVPSFVWIVGVILVVLTLLLTQSRPGKYIRAVGRDQRATELSGINAKAYLVLAYAICGMCASLAALLLSAQLGSGQGTIGSAYSFQSIAVCIIGGVSLLGGRGSVLQVVLAAVFLQLMNNGFELLRVPSPVQAVVAGIIVIIVAVLNLKKQDA